MPQKKNPDSMELVRGKSGRVFGDLMSLLSMIKGLPLAYNKDMQEDKEAVFDAYKTVYEALEVATIVLKNLTLNREIAADVARRGFLNATELADYLVKKGVPFRSAHGLVGKIVLHAAKLGKEIEDLSLESLRKFSAQIDEDVFQALSLENTLNSKNQIGGTSTARVVEALKTARNSLVSGCTQLVRMKNLPSPVGERSDRIGEAFPAGPT